MGLTEVKKKRRRGFLPMETNLFDRFFIGIITYVAVHLLWYRFLEQYIPIRVANIMMIGFLAAVMKWG